MQTLQFEDRDWQGKFVSDDNGRLVAREDYEVMEEFREALRSYNEADASPFMRRAFPAVLIGGLLWSFAVLLW